MCTSFSLWSCLSYGGAFLDTCRGTGIHGVGLLEVLSLLAAQSPATPFVALNLSRSSASSCLYTPPGGEGCFDPHYGYCKDGHPVSLLLSSICVTRGAHLLLGLVLLLRHP